MLAGLAALLTLVAWTLRRQQAGTTDTSGEQRLPGAGMGPASLALGTVLLIALAARDRYTSASTFAYWAIVAIARSAGTSMGDFLAETKALGIGLPLSTLLTGSMFAVVALWRSGRCPERARAA